MYYLLRAEAYKSQPMFGRHGAHKHHDSMAEVSFNCNYSSVINNTYILLLFILYRFYKVKAMLHLLSSSIIKTPICKYLDSYFGVLKYLNEISFDFIALITSSRK